MQSIPQPIIFWSFGMPSILAVLVFVFLATAIVTCFQSNAAGQFARKFFMFLFGGVLVVGLLLGVIAFPVRTFRSAAYQPAPAQLSTAIENHPQALIRVEPESLSAANTSSPSLVTEDVYSTYLVEKNRWATKSESVPVETQPTWVTEATTATHDGRRTKLVLASKRYATIEEAHQDVFRQAVQEVSLQFQERYPSLAARTADWSPETDLLKEVGALKRQCVTTYSIEVGEDKVPVYQVYWDMELTPETAQRLYAAWKPNLIRDRLVMLGGAIATMTAGLGISSLALRRLTARTT